MGEYNYQTEAVYDAIKEQWGPLSVALTRATDGKEPIAAFIVVAWADGEVVTVQTPHGWHPSQVKLTIDRMAKCFRIAVEHMVKQLNTIKKSIEQ